MFATAGDPTLPPPPQLPPQQHPGILPIMEMDGRWKAHIQQAPNCPRCASTHTKFCYYNNYSLAQPRYFCKGCRRYWTKGGSLRNVPVGGGCRKSRRSRSKHHLPTTTSAHKPGGGPDPSNPHSTSSSPEIDMAAVFANYLNQDQSASQPQCFESSSPIQQLASHNTAIEQQEANTTIPRLESFNHGPLLHTEDVFWSASEDGSSLSSGLAPNWEPMAAQQELDSSPLALYSAAVLDDQFSVSANSLLSDINWSCFDLPGYGDFCTSA